MSFFNKYLFNKDSAQICVDIGNGFLKIVMLQFTAGKPTLCAYKCEDLTSIEDQQKKDALILKTTESFVKSHGFSNKSIILNLSLSTAVYIKTLKMPAMPEKEIANAAKWQIKDESTIKLSDAEFAWEYAASNPKFSRSKTEIIAIAAKKKTLDDYVSLFKAANISLSKITLSPFSINNIINSSNIWFPVLDIGYKQSVFSIYSNNRLLFARIIHLGAKIFNSADQNNQEILDGYLEHLSDEIIRSIKYCELEFTKQQINTLFLTGGGAKIEYIQQGLLRLSGLDIKILRFPRNVVIEKAIQQDFEKQRASFVVLQALGAGLYPRKGLNLLPVEAKFAKTIILQKTALRLIAVTLSFALLLSFLGIKFNLKILAAKTNNAKNELEYLERAKVLSSQIEQYSSAIEKIKSDYTPAHLSLKLISNLLPSNAVLNYYEQSSERRAVNIQGVVYSQGSQAQDIVSGFIKNLKDFHLFKEVRLISLEKDTGGYSVFTITCELI